MTAVHAIVCLAVLAVACAIGILAFSVFVVGRSQADEENDEDGWGV